MFIEVIKPMAQWYDRDRSYIGLGDSDWKVPVIHKNEQSDLFPHTFIDLRIFIEIDFTNN